MSGSAGRLRRLCRRPPTRPDARGSRTVAKQVRQDRPPGGHRGDPQEAEGRRAPARLRDRRRLRGRRVLIIGCRGLPADQGLVGPARVRRPRARRDRRAASVCQDITTKKADGNQHHVPTGHRGRLRGRARRRSAPHWNEAGVAPAPIERKFYTDRRPARAGVAGAQPRARLHDPLVRRDHRRRRRRDDRAPRASPTKFSERPTTSATSSSPSVDLRGRRRLPRRPAHRVHALVASAATARPTPESRSASGSTAPSSSGEALEHFMMEYPYIDSPEPDVR